MKYKFEYSNNTERENIVNGNSNLYLIEEQNITEGNFLIYSDVPIEPETEVIYMNVPQEDFDSIKQQNAQMILALVQGGLM
jgi:hypothetical protein